MFGGELHQNREVTLTLLHPVKISNAGLVLLSPFLPRLFHLLNLMDGHQFKDSDARIRAIFILQRVIYDEGRYTEEELLLNKIMTGFTPDRSLPSGLSLTEEECAMVNTMLLRVIDFWEQFKKYSISGFRSTFLERDGRLEEQDGHLLLTVEQRPYDRLLDTVPWSYAPVEFTWMDKPLQVRWR